jgi:hypothetical protein
MEESKEQLCAGVGTRVTLVCAALGALAALALMSTVPGRSEDVRAALRTGWPMIAGGLTALFLTAGILGREVGRNISRRKRGYAGAMLMGVGVALFSLALAALVGGTIGFILERSVGWDGVGVIYVAGAIVTFYGFLPAALLGALYGAVLRWRLTKAGC